MELSSFISLLQNEREAGDKGEQAREAAEALRKENPFLFLKLCLQTINSAPTTPNNIVAAAILKLYGMTKINQLYLDESSLGSFWEEFAATIHRYLLLPEIQPQQKKIFVETLSSLYLTLLQNEQDVSPLCDFIFSILQENNEFIPYMTLVLTNILQSSENFGGMNPDLLVSFFFEAELPDDITRIQLYFAIAKHDLQRPELHTNFEHIIVSMIKLKVKPDYFTECFRILEKFSSKYSPFLIPHLDLIAAFATSQIQTENSSELKINALYTLQNIAENIPRHCMQTDKFYIPCFETLLGTMNICDPNNYILNEFSYTTETVARDVFHDISKTLACHQISKLLFDIFHHILSSETELPRLYGILLGMSYISRKMSAYLFINNHIDPCFYEPLFNLIMSNGPPNHIKYAASLALSNLLKIFPNTLAKDIKDTHLIHLFELIEKGHDDFNVFLAYIHCLSTYFSTMSPKLFTLQEFDETLGRLFAFFEAYKENLNLMTNLMKCFRKFVKNSKNYYLKTNNEGVKYINIIHQFLSSQIDMFEELTRENILLKNEVIFCFVCTLKYRNIYFYLFKEGDITLIEKFYVNLYEILKHPDLYDPSLIPKLNKYMHQIILHMGHFLTQHSAEIIDEAYHLIEKPINEIFQQYRPEIDNDITKKQFEQFYFVPNPEPEKSFYVYNTTIQNYQYQFENLQYILRSSPEMPLEQIDSILSACHNFFTQMMVEPLRLMALQTIHDMFINRPPSFLLERIPPIIDAFSSQLDLPWSMEGIQTLCSIMQAILRKLIPVKDDIDPEVLNPLLPFLVFFSQELFGEKRNRKGVSVFCHFIRSLGALIQGPVMETFIAQIKEHTDSYLKDDDFILIAIDVTLAFVSVSHDEALFDEYFNQFHPIFEEASSLNEIDPVVYSTQEKYLSKLGEIFEDEEDDDEEKKAAFHEQCETSLKIIQKLNKVLNGYIKFLATSQLSEEKTVSYLQFLIDYRNSNIFIQRIDETLDFFNGLISVIILNHVPDDHKAVYFNDWWKFGIVKQAKASAFEYAMLLLFYFDVMWDSVFKQPDFSLISTSMLREAFSRITYFYKLDDNDIGILSLSQMESVTQRLHEIFQAHQDARIQFNVFVFLAHQEGTFVDNKEVYENFKASDQLSYINKVKETQQCSAFCAKCLKDLLEKESNPNEDPSNQGEDFLSDSE